MASGFGNGSGVDMSPRLEPGLMHPKAQDKAPAPNVVTTINYTCYIVSQNAPYA